MLGLGVAARVGGGSGSQIMGVRMGVGVVACVGGGAGSQTIGPTEHTRAPPYRMTVARIAFCRSAGSMFQGTM